MTIPDVTAPVVNIGQSREEIFIVYFDGFIKNTCEGIIRTMLRDDDIWMDRYPYLESFDEFDSDELYENTLLFKPMELLDVLGEGKVSKDQIIEDLNIIRPDIILDNSKITTFEFTLFKLLHENFVKKCYIFKEDSFFENEIAYIKRQYHEVIGKIEFVNGGFLTLFEEVKPTTVCINDKELVLDYMASNEYPDDNLEGVMFIFNNDLSNVMHNEETDSFDYKEDFKEKMNEINKNKAYLVSTMYNIALNTEDLDNFIKHEGSMQTTEED